jgi:hypothetical protein
MPFIDINYPITHVRQPREGQCWLAALAMLRHRNFQWACEQARLAQIPTNESLSSPHAGQLIRAMGLHTDGIWGIHLSLTIERLAPLLSRSPVMVLGLVNQATGPARQHALIISGMRGLTEEGPGHVFVSVHDPGLAGGDRVLLSQLNTATISRVDMLVLR